MPLCSWSVFCAKKLECALNPQRTRRSIIRLETFEIFCHLTKPTKLAIVQTCSTLREIATGAAKARALSLVAHFHSLGEVELSQAHALEVAPSTIWKILFYYLQIEPFNASYLP